MKSFRCQLSALFMFVNALFCSLIRIRKSFDLFLNSFSIRSQIENSVEYFNCIIELGF